MKKLFLIFLLMSSGVVKLHSQTVSSIVGYSNSEYNYQELSIRNTELFDTKEIKTKRIKSCTIIHPWYYWDKKINVTDTLFIFDFDSTGNIARKIRFNSWPRDYRDTTIGSLSEKDFYSLIESTELKQNNLTLVTKYYIWPFNYESQEVDTGYIKEITYDERRRMINFKMNGTSDYFNYTFCGTGITHDKKYRYDNKDRIIFYQDAYSREYATFQYNKHRRIIQVYDSLTNELKRKSVVHIDINSKTITERDASFTVTLTRLSNGSNLFSQISHKQNGKGFTPHNYLLIYEYFDNPFNPTKERLLVTKK